VTRNPDGAPDPVGRKRVSSFGPSVGSADHQTRKKRRQGKIQGKPNTKKYLVRGFLQFMRRKYGFVTVECWV